MWYHISARQNEGKGVIVMWKVVVKGEGALDRDRLLRFAPCPPSRVESSDGSVVVWFDDEMCAEMFALRLRSSILFSAEGPFEDED